VLCKFYQQGHCKVGEDCDFLHPGINGPSRPSRFTTRFSSPPPSGHQSRTGGRVNSPLKDDDNWESPKDEPFKFNRDDKFDRPPPSSPTSDEGPSSERPKVIPPINESEAILLD